MKVPVMALCERCKEKMTDIFILEPVEDIWDMSGQCYFCGRKTYTIRCKYERRDERQRRAGREAKRNRKDTRAKWRPPFREEWN